MNSRGRFIVLEGGEGSGKTTQAALLADAIGALLSREPGGTPLGEQLRAILLNPDSGTINIRAELLMMLAARAQHVGQVLRPALESGRTVVCDRYYGSTLAYQGYGHQQDVAALASISRWAADELMPDLVLYLDVPSGEAQRRTTSRTLDRIESYRGGFHDRVARGFNFLCSTEPNWIRVDAVGSISQVTARLLATCIHHGVISPSDVAQPYRGVNSA